MWNSNEVNKNPCHAGNGDEIIVVSRYESIGSLSVECNFIVELFRVVNSTPVMSGVSKAIYLNALFVQLSFAIVRLTLCPVI